MLRSLSKKEKGQVPLRVAIAEKKQRTSPGAILKLTVKRGKTTKKKNSLGAYKRTEEKYEHTRKGVRKHKTGKSHPRDLPESGKKKKTHFR